MSREEQIIEASRNPIFKTGLIRLDDISFIAGAKWADENQPSPWISTDDLLKSVLKNLKV